MRQPSVARMGYHRRENSFFSGGKMLLEGVKLMFVGMTTVLLFLSFMIILLQLVTKLTADITQRELDSLERERIRKTQQNERRKAVKLAASSDNKDEDIAVIAAAIAAFEAEKQAAQ